MERTVENEHTGTMTAHELEIVPDRKVAYIQTSMDRTLETHRQIFQKRQRYCQTWR
jgi:hypothetical protein